MPTSNAATTRPTGAGRRVQVQGMPVRRWLTTTPGKLRVASVVVASVLLVVGVVAGLATTARRDATRAVAEEGTSELVAAQSMIAALADADDAASTAYLKPGIEPRELRRRYDDDIEAAGRYLTLLGAATTSSAEARRAVQAIEQTLPTYTEKMGESRANERLGRSVSSSYLRGASALMRETILPNARIVYEHAATRLDGAYESGTSAVGIIAVAGVGLVAFALLAGLQLYVFKRTHRIVNVGLVAATGALVVLVGWTLVAFGTQQSELVGAQRHGSDAVQILSSTRILALRIHNDDNLALIRRGSGDSYVDDYDAIAARIGDDQGHGGLLDVAAEIAARSGSTEGIDHLRSRYAVVAAAHTAVRQADDNAQYDEALELASSTKTVAAVDAFDRDLGIEIARARVELDQRAADARSGFGVLLVVIPVLTACAGLLVLFGLQRRIGEYR